MNKLKYDIIIHLKNFQMMHITHDNIIEFRIINESTQKIYENGNQSFEKSFIENAVITFHPSLNVRLKNNQIDKIQILYEDSTMKYYHLHENKFYQHYIQSNDQDTLTIAINVFDSNDLIDLHLDFKTHHTITESNIHWISEILSLNERDLINIINPSQSHKYTISDSKPDIQTKQALFLIERWLNANNIPKYSVPIMQYDNHPNFLLESSSIYKLNLNTRAYNSLKRTYVQTIYQLLHISPKELKGFRNVGQDTFDEIISKTILWCDLNDIAEFHKYPLISESFKNISQHGDFEKIHVIAQRALENIDVEDVKDEN